MFPEQIDEGLAPHAPDALYHSHFPRSRMLLLEHLVQWLVTQDRRFRGSFDFMHALLLLAQETSVLGYASDHTDVQWYPAGFSWRTYADSHLHRGERRRLRGNAPTEARHGASGSILAPTATTSSSSRSTPSSSAAPRSIWRF